MLRAIVAVDRQWGIGFQGDLLFSIPEDQKGVFRAHTIGNTVVLGRKTLDTFPGRKVLPGRTNLVMTRDEQFIVPGAEIIHSLDSFLEYLKVHSEDDIYVIGGEQIYSLLLPFCEEAIVTYVDAQRDADAFFTNLDAAESWRIDDIGPWISSVTGLAFRVLKYQNLRIKGR